MSDEIHRLEQPDFHVGSAKTPPGNWRDDDDDADDDPDDELLDETPQSVIDVLGFDPLEFDGEK